MKTYKSVLAIAGSDSGGGAGIQADIKTISALHCFATTAITCVTAQNTLGVQAIEVLSANFVAKQIHSVLSDIGADAIKIGMLHNEQVIQNIIEALSQFSLPPIVLDPVMIATSGDVLIEKEAIEFLKKELIPKVTLITPNIHEASLLTHHKTRTVDEMKKACLEIAKLGVKNILIKGGDRQDDWATDVFYQTETQKFHLFTTPMIKTINTHGTGCSLSSAIATHLALGFEIQKAIELSKIYIQEAIFHGQDYQTGQGIGPIHHFWKKDKK